MLDQQFALDWVSHNIAGFGGNPRQVTVFGESAGGQSVSAQLASPTAHGLFERAIIESSGAAFGANQLDIQQAEAVGNALAQALGCAADDAACLRSATVEDILARSLSGTNVIVDGTTLPVSLRVAFETGQFNRVPVIIGTNRNEGTLAVTTGADLYTDPKTADLTAENYPAAVAAAYGAALAPELQQRYPADSFDKPILALAAIATDRGFACPAHLLLETLAQYVRVYAYEFADENAPDVFQPPLGFSYGAAHTTKLSYLFNLQGVPFPAVLSRRQRQLSRFMIAEWTNFAQSGDPSVPPRWRTDEGGAGWGARFTPAWPAWRDDRRNIETLAPPVPRPGSDDAFVQAHQCDFWGPILNPS